MHKVGIIGYGNFGRFIHQAWKIMDNVKIVALSDGILPKDLDPEINFYHDWKELLKNEDDVDIVAIATTPNTHAEISTRAMEAGKHVFIEKPIATTLEDAELIRSVKYKTGMQATADHLLRYNPIIESVAKLSHKKIFGELRRADVENYAQDTSLPPGHWFWDLEVSGGIMVEHGIPFIDLVNYISGQKYTEVNGFIHHRTKNQTDQVIANVLYRDGLMATHYHSFARPGFFENTSIRLEYDLAQIDIEGWMPLSGTIRALVNAGNKDKLQWLPGFSLTELKKTPHKKVFSAGIGYHVEEIVSGTFKINDTKENIYAGCLRSILSDFIVSVDDLSYEPRVLIKDAITSLEIALKTKHVSDKPDVSKLFSE